MQGQYFDPLHGGCLRTVVRLREGDYLIRGVYGSDETPTGGAWHARIAVLARDAAGAELDVDFAGKPAKRPRHMAARFDAAAQVIRWSDGNVWTRLHAHPSQTLAPPRGSSRLA